MKRQILDETSNVNVYVIYQYSLHEARALTPAFAAHQSATRPLARTRPHAPERASQTTTHGVTTGSTCTTTHTLATTTASTNARTNAVVRRVHLRYYGAV